VNRPRWALALGACAAVALAACGGGSAPKADNADAAHATSSTTSSTVTTTTVPPSTTSNTASTPGSAACARVSASPAAGQGAAGTITGTVTVTNTGSTACTANGYPTIALASGSGAPLTVTMVNGLSVDVSAAANAPPSTVSLPPSGTAQFAYQFSDVPTGSETSCPTSESATVTMPGATTASASFALAIDPCNNGTVRVSPIYAS
jgi:hypothetical protein